MPYITIPIEKKDYQLSLEDLFSGINEEKFNRDFKDTFDTRTVFKNQTPEQLLFETDFKAMIDVLKEFINKNKRFGAQDKRNLYETFYLAKTKKGFPETMKEILRKSNSRIDYGKAYSTIHTILKPLLDTHECIKHEILEVETLKKCADILLNDFNVKVDEAYIKNSIKKGFRRIDAPKQEFKSALRELMYILEYKCYALHHTTAFAYVKKRCAVDAVRRHQRNKSKWFLKLDFSNFFGSITPEFTIKQLSQVFPFNVLLERDKDTIEKALDLCFLDGSLPQGTPISPLLTNIIMIPIDHEISKAMRNNSPHLIYTRYADDIQISGEIKFDKAIVIDKVKAILGWFKVPFELNTEKTRFGSSAGRNWNLGVMLTKDNTITIGHERKKYFKASLFSFIKDGNDPNKFSVQDAQVLSGQISYYTSIEKEPIEKIIESYNKKYNVDIKKLLKNKIANC